MDERGTVIERISALRLERIDENSLNYWVSSQVARILFEPDQPGI